MRGEKGGGRAVQEGRKIKPAATEPVNSLGVTNQPKRGKTQGLLWSGVGPPSSSHESHPSLKQGPGGWLKDERPSKERTTGWKMKNKREKNSGQKKDPRINRKEGFLEAHERSEGGGEKGRPDAALQL